MKIDLFPTHNINSNWWIRLLKVLIVAATCLFFIFYYYSFVAPDMGRQPYYAYSFDPKFNTYNEPIINCDGVPGKCSGGQNGDATGIVQAYQVSSPERNNEVEILNPIIGGTMTDEQVLKILEDRGEITNALKAKDINRVNEFLLHDWMLLIIYTILAFLLLSQIGLRIIFYIIYGRKNE